MADMGFSQIAPWGAAGFSALGDIFSLIQTFQRQKQLDELRRFYADPSAITGRAQQFMNWMQPAAKGDLSTLIGDAASRGWSQYPQGLANLVSRAYAPYQGQALQWAMGYGNQAAPFTTPQAGYTNPFEAYLRTAMAASVQNPYGTPTGAQNLYAPGFSPENPENTAAMFGGF